LGKNLFAFSTNRTIIELIFLSEYLLLGDLIMNRPFSYILLSLQYICLTIVFALSLISIIASGSGGATDDDNNNDDNTQMEFKSCEETTRTLANIDEESTLLSISAADLLAEVGDGFTTTSFYSNDTSVLTQSPLGGEIGLTIVISYNGGEIREIESQPVDGNGDIIAPEIAVDCRNRLEIDVSIALSTADGAFSENWHAVLVKSVNSGHDGFDDPYLTAEFESAGIEGTFKIVSIPGETPDSVTGSLSTSAINPYNGSIDILVQQTNGEGEDATVSLTRHVALSWGETQ
jgi:hypothetical protein